MNDNIGHAQEMDGILDRLGERNDIPNSLSFDVLEWHRVTYTDVEKWMGPLNEKAVPVVTKRIWTAKDDRLLERYLAKRLNVAQIAQAMNRDIGKIRRRKLLLKMRHTIAEDDNGTTE